MHNRHGIIGKSVIDSVRRSLQNKYAEDRHIQQMIEELDAADDLTYGELHITKQAYEEVKSRLFYTALLDSLWQEISETQDLLAQLHVYDSLEDEFQSQEDELTKEELTIDQVDLADVDVTERPLAVRQTSAVAERQAGTVTARQEGTIVARPDGVVVSSVNSEANETNPNLTNSKSATTGVTASRAVLDTEVPWAPLTQGQAEANDLAVENTAAGTKAVLNAKAATASSVADSEGADEDVVATNETSDVTAFKSAKEGKKSKAHKTKAKEDVYDDRDANEFPTGEIFLQDIFNMLSKGLPQGEAGQLTIDDLMQHTEWKEFKKLAKQAKKSIKKAQKTAKKEAKKLAKDTKKETKKALKKAKRTKQDVESLSESWYQDFEAASEELAKEAKGKAKKVKGKACETLEATKDKATEVANKVEQQKQELVAKATEVSSQAKEKGHEVTAKAKDKANEVTVHAKDKASDVVEQAKATVQTVTEKASDVKETMQDLGRSAVLQVLDIVEAAIQKKPKK